MGSIEEMDSSTPSTPHGRKCRIVGPYFPTGEIDWECLTHGTICFLKDMSIPYARDVRREDFYCPAREPYE
jgi:hypothetical protein